MVHNNFVLPKERDEVLHFFRNKQFTLFVEGIDDKCFWANHFIVCGFDPYIEEVNGKLNFQKKIDSIKQNNTKVLVCCDRDYIYFYDNFSKQPNFVYTFGYSIENQLYCKFSINRVIQKYTRKLTEFIQHIDDEYRIFANNIYDLLARKPRKQRYGNIISD